MNVESKFLAKEEQIYYALQELYQKNGYRKFKMRKFEEYSLYLENKNFLMSENVITFNDPSGKLLALRPDVTLSIVKNAKATEKNLEKVYYSENVYRLDRHSKEFREISQIGLEYIGEVDLVSTVEIALLAIKSLDYIDSKFIFTMSHIGFISGLIDSLELTSEKAKQKVALCLQQKNAHDLMEVATKYNISNEKIDRVAKIASSDSSFENALALAKSLVCNEQMANGVLELENIYFVLKETKFVDKLRLDFSIINDINYYNGVIFQGFIDKCPRVILSGGRYDLLLKQSNENIGAMGFALSLQDLANLFSQSNEVVDVDTVLLYNYDSDITKIMERAELVRSEGQKVLVVKSLPTDIKYNKVE
ncbi:MAG: ATP phosphoribosyltransferase regulatory subunit, partial [Clostridia bacterium]